MQLRFICATIRAIEKPGAILYIAPGYSGRRRVQRGKFASLQPVSNLSRYRPAYKRQTRIRTRAVPSSESKPALDRLG